MKKPLIYWILSSILFQIVLFAYLDRIVFAPAVAFTQKAVEDEEARQVIGSPANTSFAYLGEGWLKVYDHQSGFVGEFAAPEGGKASYFEYYPELNRIIVGFNLTKNGTLLSREINTQTGQVREWQVNGLAKGAAVAESAYTGKDGTLYLLVRDGSSTYLYQVGQELERVKTNTTQINRIAGFSGTNLLLFDNKSRGAIYSLDSQGQVKQLALPKGSYTLIGVDEVERIYLGQLSDKKKVAVLLAGYLEGGFIPINKYAKPLEPQGIRISAEGDLLISPSPE